MIDWGLMLTQGVVLAATITYHEERFLKPLLTAIYSVLSALLFKEKVPEGGPFVNVAQQAASKAEALQNAFKKLFGLWPYYVTVAVSVWLVSLSPLRFYSALWAGRVDMIMSGLTVAGGAGFIFDLAKEVGKWREMLAEATNKEAS